MIQGEYVLNTLFGVERVWNGHPVQHDFSGTAFDGLERRGLERNSGT